MTLPTTNVSFSSIQTEFGGSNPISLSEYYRGGSYVKSNTNMPNGTIATSGAISISTFRGATQGVTYPAYGTYLGQYCSGYNLYYTYADGSGGSYDSLYQSNSATCGYSPPVPTATWSVGYSNNGTPGPISSFVAVNLSSAALSTVTFSFSGVVVDNGVTYPIPNVTIAAGQTSGSANTYVGIVNGSGPYSTITLQASVSSAPYTITNGSTINTSFSYSA